MFVNRWKEVVLLVAVVAILFVLGSEPAHAYDCNRWSSSATFDSGDDGCFAWCVNGTPTKHWCEGASWSSMTVTYTCVDDPDECPNPCQVDSQQNGTWEICDCQIQCPITQYQEEGHFWEGAWVFCLVCP